MDAAPLSDVVAWHWTTQHGERSSSRGVHEPAKSESESRPGKGQKAGKSTTYEDALDSFEEILSCGGHNESRSAREQE